MRRVSQPSAFEVCFAFIEGRFLNKMPIPKWTSRRFRKAVIAAIAAASLTASGISTTAEQPVQRPAAPRPPVVRPSAGTETPQSTSATYDDWVVQCQMQVGTPPKKICVMEQVTQVKGKNVPFSRLMITQPLKGDLLKLVVLVPVNVSLAAKVRLQRTASDVDMAVAFSRCVPIGCFADFEINDELLKKLRAVSGAGKLTFADAGGHDVVIPVSFKGFGAALDAMMRG